MVRSQLCTQTIQAAAATATTNRYQNNLCTSLRYVPCVVHCMVVRTWLRRSAVHWHATNDSQNEIELWIWVVWARFYGAFVWHAALRAYIIHIVASSECEWITLQFTGAVDHLRSWLRERERQHYLMTASNGVPYDWCSERTHMHTHTAARRAVPVALNSTVCSVFPSDSACNAHKSYHSRHNLVLRRLEFHFNYS